MNYLNTKSKYLKNLEENVMNKYYGIDIVKITKFNYVKIENLCA